jgi:hypothetical protein
MKPSHVSRELRRIASKIDGSMNLSSKLVANDLKRVLAAMGGQSSEMIPGTNKTWNEVKNTLVSALDSDFVPGDVESFDYIGNLDELNSQIGLNFTIVVDDESNVGLMVQFEGDSDYAWEGTLDSLSVEKEIAASKAISMAKNMLKFSVY